MRKVLLSLAIMSTHVLLGQNDLSYQIPPEPLKSLVDITPAPIVSFAPDNQSMLLINRNYFKTIEEVSQKEYRIAGTRINPANFTQSRQSFYTGFDLYDLKNEQTFTIEGLPEKANLYGFNYSPNGEKIAALNATENGVELWIVNLNNRNAEKLDLPYVNDALPGSSLTWKPDGSGILVKVKSDYHTNEPQKPIAPAGPVVQEADGKKSTVRTYQDLLSNPFEEQLFEYFATSNLISVNLDGSTAMLLENVMLRSFSFSPNGKYLLYTTIEKPFSYLVPWYSFPNNTYILDLRKPNEPILFNHKPLTINLPQGFDATSTGKRYISWRTDEPATLVWVEALDGGDPAVETEFRDEVFVLSSPFNGKEKSIGRTKLRFAGVDWGNENTAVLYDRWYKNRTSNVYLINPKKSNPKPEVLFALNTEDRYADPGDFLSERDEKGRYTLRFSPNKKSLYLTGQGYGPEGNRPFLDRFDLKSKKTTRLWQAKGDSTYENIVKVLDPEKGEIFTRIESNTQNPNYFLRNFKEGSLKQITSLTDPYEGFKGVSKETITYTRADGVELNATLYLPKGYDKEKDGPLPAIMWAYPREFKSTKTAGQITKSPHTYTYLYYGSPVYWAAMGYAIIDGAAFPIIGQGEDEPNDTFVEQLVANAEAAINYTANELGVVDKNRVAVGGHSYGAFMTANLLAHSNLFAAGIARSGAYNRTFTPFGFQSEERTYWQAPEVYNTISPFMNADKIKTPILLIHGDSDNNSGTFPIQSERLFEAIKGLGGTARLVMLPNESHGYAARESILHMIWEQNEWLEKYVKNK
jgi:dipeptidyl aminopeptidase/acylaminoacyl peptidase